MLAYAYALGQMEQNPERDSNGVCYLLRDFLSSELKYSLENFFFFLDGPYNFPELWKEKTVELDKEDANVISWFNNNQERIEALKNILKTNT